MSGSISCEVYDVSEDGSMCAIVSNATLQIFDVLERKLKYNITESTGTIKTKCLKIAPNNRAIVWLQSEPNILELIYSKSGKVSKVSSLHDDYPYTFILWSPKGDIFAAFSCLSMFIDFYSVDNCKNNLTTSVSGAKIARKGSPLAQFSPDGDYFCTVNVCSHGHCIALYTTEDASLNCIQRVCISGSSMLDVEGLMWTKDSAALLLWSGSQLCLQIHSLTGHLEHKLITDDPPISCLALSQCGRTAALLSTDGKVRIIDLLTGQIDPMGTLVHCSIIHVSSARSRLRETSSSHNKHITVCKEVADTLVDLSPKSPQVKRCSLLSFSQDAQFLASYQSSLPQALWVWNLANTGGEPLLDTLIILSGSTHVLGLSWHVEKMCLAATLSQNKLLVWKPQQTVVLSQYSCPWPLTSEMYFATD